MKRILFVATLLFLSRAAIYGQCGTLDTSNYHVWFFDNFDYPVPTGSDGWYLMASTASGEKDTTGTSTVLGHSFSDNWNCSDDSYYHGDHFGTNGLTGSDTTYTQSLPDNVTMTAPGIIRLIEHLVPTYSVPGPYHPLDITHTTGYLHSTKEFAGYGILQARIKLPADEAVDPGRPAEGAFWTSSPTEIDVLDVTSSHHMESSVIEWRDDTTYNYDRFFRDPAGSTTLPDCPSAINDLSTDWHIWSCLWSPIDVSFFIDGEFLFDAPYNQARSYPGLSFVIFDVIPWGNMPPFSGHPSGLTETADGFFMDVDWVKVWEQNCLSGDLNVCTGFTTIVPGLYKRSSISASSTSLVSTNDSEATVFEADATTITANFIADESTPMYHTIIPPGSHWGTYQSNGFLEILPIVCGSDSNNWFMPGHDTTKHLVINSINNQTFGTNSATFDDSQQNPTAGYSQIQVFPNPTQDNITITYPCQAAGELDISIKEVSGRVRYTQSISCNEGSNINYSIDMSAYVAGVYFIDLTYNSQHVVKKIVKL